MQYLPQVTQADILKRGIRCQCPNCGHPELFRTRLRINRQCPSCGMTLERGDGFYLGPLCINYGLVAFTYVSPILIFGFMEWIPLKFALAAALIGGIFLPIFLYRPSWSWWLMIYYMCLPEELHANHPEDSDDLSFEEERRS